MTHTEKRFEIRKCIHCGQEREILQRHKHKNNICIECERERSNSYAKKAAIAKGKRIGQIGRVPYPLTDEFKTPLDKFRSIAKIIYKLKERDEWVTALRNNLDKTFNDKEVMDWINAHGDDEPIKKQKKIESDYPDSRNMTWDDYERGLGEEDVDS